MVLQNFFSFVLRLREHLGKSYHAVGRNISLCDIFRLTIVVARNNLDPVLIGVQDKGDIPHPAIGQLLLEWIPSVLDTLAGSLDVIDTDTGVTKPTMRVLVSIIDLVLGVVLSAIVVSELDETFSVKGRVSLRNGPSGVITQEVEVELVVRELELFDNAHSQEPIELN